jgi:hypothetical protein
MLLWVRWPLRFLLMLVATLAQIALPIVDFGLASGAPHKTSFMMIITANGFAAFVGAHSYDSLLLRCFANGIVTLSAD